jgi:8-oxo-dGTP diphosphatase
MPLYVVRHAEAGSRRSWSGPDHLRPLSKRGTAQAEVIARRFDDIPLDRILSSPFTRCVQTVEPLALSRRSEMITSDDLAEGTPVERVIALMVKMRDESSVLCSHGDVIEALIPRLVLGGMRVDGPAGFAKGSVWELHAEEGSFVLGRYWGAP